MTVELPTPVEVDDVVAYISVVNKQAPREEFIRERLYKMINSLAKAPPDVTGSATMGFLLTKCDNRIEIWIRPPQWFKQ
jgi:hypothetical protein